MNRPELGLAVAMQEADGRMVVQMIDMIQRSGAQVVVPAWFEQQWTDYLRSLYEGASLEEMLRYLTAVGSSKGFESRTIPELSTDTKTATQLTLTFPKGTIRIQAESSMKDAKQSKFQVDLNR
ncbi:hypothetical protein [Paenibacillus koleovorans]|uniref:hypothetical protein n=1 Tax=Paenibacillus koleovorans TaxID=121608 RepID=UPI000FD9A3F4|nr:hypothetical protein [Paenibacillus koleovorans]